MISSQVVSFYNPEAGDRCKGSPIVHLAQYGVNEVGAVRNGLRERLFPGFRPHFGTTASDDDCGWHEASSLLFCPSSL